MSTVKTYNVDSGDTTNLVLKTNGTTALTINGTTQAVTFAGSISGNQTVTGNLSVNGNTTLGDASGDTVTITGTVQPGVVIAAGTASSAPLDFTAGTNLTSALAGAVEYDGVRFYGTTDTDSGRGYVPSTQIFRLAGNGSAIGSTIANFFGANSAINLAAGGAYELEAYCYFTKTTNGTVTVTLTTSAAVVNLNGTVQYGAAVGGTATGASNQINLFASAATANAFGASASLTTAVNHLFIVRAVLDANASASNLRINFTESAGTVTPLRNSYYKVTRLPASNTGSYAA
jgi:hypothetical protein